MGRPLLMVAGNDPTVGAGGHPSYVRAHARAAVRAGFEPHLYCVSPEAGEVPTEFGVVHRIRSPWPRALPARGYRARTIWFHAPLLARAVARAEHAAAGLGVVHAFGVWGWAAVAGVRGLARRGIRAVPVVSAYTTLLVEARAKRDGLTRAHGVGHRLAAAYDVLAMRALASRTEGAGIAGARLVLVNYESVRRRLHAAFGPGLPIRKMPYASEAAFVHEPAPPARPPPPPIARLTPRGAPLVVAVSRHDPRKGLDVLLRALARLRAAGVPFRACLVGGQDLLEVHRRLATRLGLEGETVLTGVVPDPFLYLRAADVFVLPSLEEASGSLALLEAWQAGLAAVASRVDGVPEDVAHGVDGLLVPPGDAGALAAALRRLLEDRPLRARLARAGRVAYEARFVASGLTGALAELYAEIEAGLRALTPAPGP